MSITLYIASSSTRRIDILEHHKIPFVAIKNLLLEEPKPLSFEAPAEYAMRLAFEKARASIGNHKGLILGCDTVVEKDGKLYGKPRTLDEASSFLSELSGGSHHVISACALHDSFHDDWYFCVDHAVVTFVPENKSIINDYVLNARPIDKAGGYGIQDKPPFISTINGDFYTIMGLPINRLLKIFSHYGIVK